MTSKISGQIYDVDGKTVVLVPDMKDPPVHIEVLDARGGGTGQFGDFRNGEYSFTVDPATLAPDDKVIILRVTRKQGTREISGLAVNVAKQQTVHITVADKPFP